MCNCKNKQASTLSLTEQQITEKYINKVLPLLAGEEDGEVGFFYANGIGLPENYIRAYVWWSMAKTQGLKEAAESLDDLKPLMTKQQIAQAQALATKCYESDYEDCD